MVHWIATETMALLMLPSRDVEELWMDHFDYFYREYDEFIFPMTIHPDVSGRPHVLLMHERIIEHINKHEGVEWVTMGEMSDYFKSKNPVPQGGKLPLSSDAVMRRYRDEKARETAIDVEAPTSVKSARGAEVGKS
jgi:hypothetical protein